MDEVEDRRHWRQGVDGQPVTADADHGVSPDPASYLLRPARQPRATGFRIAAVGGGFLLQRQASQRRSLTRAPRPALPVEVAPVAAPRPRRRRWRRYLVLALCAPALVLLALWGLGRAAAPPQYTLGTLETRDIETSVEATGALEAVTAIDIGAEVSGRIVSILVEENASVRKGQVLAVMASEELAAAVAEARAQVASSAAALELAQATLDESRAGQERMEELTRYGVASQQELTAARAGTARGRASMNGAHAAAALARAGLAAAESRLAKANIVAPIDGIVLARLVEPGQTVAAGFQTPVLFRVAPDLKQLRLRVNVDEADVARVQAGQAASFQVAAFPDHTFASQVVRVGQDSRVLGNVVVFGATLEVDNAELLLRPGMTCTTRIVTALRKGVHAVPNAALRTLAQPPAAAPGAPAPEGQWVPSAEVWILHEGKPAAIPVATGLADDEYTEIVAGDLRPQDSIILDGGAT